MKLRSGTTWRDVVCRDRPLSPRMLAVLGAVAVAAVVMSSFLPERGAVRVGLAVVLAGLVAFVCVRSPSQGILVTLGWLAVVGGARRVVTAFQADPRLDPLLLVGPVAIAVLFVTAVASGAFSRRSLLANGMLALGIVAVLWVAHPDQGGVDVGLGGLLFWLVPMLWFWVGRGLVDRVRARRVVLFAAGVAAFAGIYGLVQGVIGFPKWDWDWIFNRGRFNSLYVGPGTYRPFAAFVAANEYALTMACGVVIFTLLVARAVFRGLPSWVVVGSMGAAVTGLALALSSIRAPLVLLALALLVVGVVRLRRDALPFVLAGIIAVGLVGVGFSRVDPDSLRETGVEGMVRRAVVGLGHPFDKDRSTLTLHLDALRSGLEEAARDPLGDGTGSTTTAALRFDNEPNGSEWDLSDGGIAFGIVGLALVAFTTIAAFALVGRRAWARPDLLHLAVLGIMVVLFRNWWNGGHYFLAPLLWVLIGALDAPARARPAVTPA